MAGKLGVTQTSQRRHDNPAVWSAFNPRPPSYFPVNAASSQSRPPPVAVAGGHPDRSQLHLPHRAARHQQGLAGHLVKRH